MIEILTSIHQAPVYDGYDSFIDCAYAIFHPIWEGLTNVCLPGTNWSFAGIFLAILTAGIIGKILKSIFGVFGSHFDSDIKGWKKRLGDRHGAEGRGE